MATLPELLDDLEDEYADTRRLVAGLGPTDPGWDLATPAQGWAVRDQISHLAFFDEAGADGHGRAGGVRPRGGAGHGQAGRPDGGASGQGAGAWTATSS